MKDISILKKGLEQFSIDLNNEQLDQFLDYYNLLIEYNSVMNLTAITDFEEVIHKHFIDSLSLVKAYNLNKTSKIIDIGTGAGFPGIPLKIAFPELEIVLLDSLNKRIKFLNSVIQTLGLNGITALHARAEDYAKQADYRESFDLCVSRAVANLSTLSEYCMPYVKIGGYFVSYKSGKINDELDTAMNAVKIFGGNLEKVENFMLPQTDIERSLVVIKKLKQTPKTYPRMAGKPAKDPIH